MGKTKLKMILTSKVAIGVLSGIIGLGIGTAMITGEKDEVQKKYEDLNIKYAEQIKESETLKSQVTASEEKLVTAKPWFELNDNEKAGIEKYQKEAKEKIEAERLAKEKIEKEEQEKQEAERKKEEEKVKAEEGAKLQAKGPDLAGIKAQIQSLVSKELAGEVEDTVLDGITVNENLGTENNNKDVIVLINLTWDRMNGEKNTKTMLDMYGSHLAAKIAPLLSDGSEICTFWDATYTGLDIKHATVVKNGKAYLQ